MGASDSRPAWPRLLTTCAVALVALQSIAGVWIPFPRARGEDDASRFARRLAPIREAVRSESIVGFVSDRRGVDEEECYYKTQYALAPVLVERGAAHRLVVGDFRVPAPDLTGFGPERRVILDLGDGALLLTGSAER